MSELETIIEIQPDAEAILANRLCARLVSEGLLERLGSSIKASQRYELFCEALADELFQVGRAQRLMSEALEPKEGA